MGLFRRIRTQPAAAVAVQAVPPNEAEQNWVAEHLRQLNLCGIDLHDPVALGAHYDALLTHWLSLPVGLRPDPNPDITMIGIGLGEYLCRQTQALNWAVVTDAAGTEMALHGQPGAIVIYPANAVAKRWADREFGFLPEFATDMVNAVARVRSDAAGD